MLLIGTPDGLFGVEHRRTELKDARASYHEGFTKTQQEAGWNENIRCRQVSDWSWVCRCMQAAADLFRPVRLLANRFGLASAYTSYLCSDRPLARPRRPQLHRYHFWAAAEQVHKIPAMESSLLCAPRLCAQVLTTAVLRFPN